LRVNLHDWDELKTRERELISLAVGGVDRAYRVRSVLRCPGGEPEEWVWLVESQAAPPDFLFDEAEPVPRKVVRVRTYRSRWCRRAMRRRC
jgi:hypothetical protein